MKKGDIVEIKGAYFESDNGIYKVKHEPDFNVYNKKDWCLVSIVDNTEKLWPLKYHKFDYYKNCEINNYNKKYATITIC